MLFFFFLLPSNRQSLNYIDLLLAMCLKSNTQLKPTNQISAHFAWYTSKYFLYKLVNSAEMDRLYTSHSLF